MIRGSIWPRSQDAGGEGHRRRLRRSRPRARGARSPASRTPSPATGACSCSSASRASARAASPRSSLARARARGALVLVGRCWEAGGAPAYWPWVQSLRAYVLRAEPGALRAQLGPGRRTSPSCCRSCATSSPTCRRRRGRAGGSALPAVRFPDRVPEARRGRAAARAGARRPARGGRAVAAAAAVRGPRAAAEPGRDRRRLPRRRSDLADPLKATLAALAREPVTRTLLLAGLPRPTSPASSRSRPPRPGPPSWVRRCTPRPRATRCSSARSCGCSREGRLADPATAPLADPAQRARDDRPAAAPSLRRQQRAAHAGLGPRARVRSPCPGPRQRARARHRPGTARRGDRSARRLRGSRRDRPHALRARPDPGRRLSPSDQARRIELHRRVGEALEAIHAADLDPHLAELAHHFYEAAAGEDRLGYARRAGARAVASWPTRRRCGCTRWRSRRSTREARRPPRSAVSCCWRSATRRAGAGTTRARRRRA